MSHTAEPWEYVDCQCGSLSCSSGGIKGIADQQGAMHKDDARRIVTCVNACKGVETDSLTFLARLMAENERLAADLRTVQQERIELMPQPCCGEFNTCDRRCLPLVRHLRKEAEGHRLQQIEHDTLGCAMAKTGIYAEKSSQGRAEMTETPSQLVDALARSVGFAIGDTPAFMAVRRSFEQLQKELEEANRLASQIITDWMPANARLAKRAEAAEQALAAHTVAWDAVIQPCYDELKKALGRDIECPAYIPDAIRELAALRGEPVAWRWKRTPDDKWSWHLSNEKPNTPWVKAIIEPLYAAPISGEQLSAPARFLAAEGEYERRMDAVSGERK